jgi:O-antigen/teichoic acid export membrane protein
MAFTVFFSAPFLASFFLLDKDLDSALMIGSIILLLSSQAGVEEGCLAGLEGFSAIAKASAVDGITVLAAMIPMTYLWGVNGAIGALIISSALRLMVLRYHVGRRCDHFGLTVSSKDFKKNLSLLMSYSIPAFLCGFMYGPAIWIFNRIVISQPDGYNMLGLISAADQWKTMILFVPGAVVVVVLPMLSNEKNRNAKRYDKIIRINILVASAIALAAALPVALFGSQIETIYGLSFKGLSAVLVIGAATAVFHSIGGAAGSAIMTNDNIWPNFLINLIWAACLIAGCYFLAGRYGVLGAAYSYLIAQVIHSVILMPYALTGKAKGVA